MHKNALMAGALPRTSPESFIKAFFKVWILGKGAKRETGKRGEKRKEIKKEGRGIDDRFHAFCFSDFDSYDTVSSIASNYR